MLILFLFMTEIYFSPVGFASVASPVPLVPEISLKFKQNGKTRFVLMVRPPAQHHFSEKAPHYLELEGFRGRIPPAIVSAAEIRFVLSAKVSKPFQLTVYLCDDAKTFCRKQVLRGVWNEKTNSFKSL